MIASATDVETRLEALEPIVQTCAKRHATRSIDAEDLAQEIRVAMWRELPNFDARLASFRTWAWNTTRLRAIDAVRRLGTRSGLSRTNYADAPQSHSLDDTTIGFEPAGGERTDQDFEHDDLMSVVMGDAELRPFGLLAAGYTQADLARKCDVSTSAISCRFKRLRNSTDIAEKLQRLGILPDDHEPINHEPKRPKRCK